MTTAVREEPTLEANIRRSVNHWLLRWQAKLEGAGPDRAIPWGVAFVLFALFAALALARYRSLELGAEFAAWLQGVWLLSEGQEPLVSITGRSLFAGQFSIVMAPVAQLARLVPAAPLLLVLQALALAIGVVPLWRIVRAELELGIEAAIVIALAYGFQPGLHNLNLSEFHPEAFAVPALLYGYLWSQRRQWIRFTGAVAFVLATRSDLALVIVGLGALLALEGRHRQGRIAAAMGAVWGMLALFVFQSDLAGGEFVHAEAFASYGDGPIAVMWGMLTDPLQVLSDFFARENYERLLLLFAPLLFLPVLKPRFQLPLVLFGAFGFIADIPPGEFGNPQQDVAALVFLPIATGFALHALGRRSVRRVFVSGRLLIGLLFATFAFWLFAAGSSLYNSPWEWGSRSEWDLDVVAAVDTVDPDESVAALEPALPLLAERVEIIEFPDEAVVFRPSDPVFNMEVIVVDEAADSWTELNRATFDQIVDALGYVVSDRFGTISVYRLDTSS